MRLQININDCYDKGQHGLRHDTFIINMTFRLSLDVIVRQQKVGVKAKVSKNIQRGEIKDELTYKNFTDVKVIYIYDHLFDKNTVENASVVQMGEFQTKEDSLSNDTLMIYYIPGNSIKYAEIY